METRILYIGDDHGVVRGLGDETAAFEVFETVDRGLALSLCRDREIHLVIIEGDPAAPDVCGFFSELKKVRPGLAGILMSSQVESGFVVDALNAGFSGLVRKPAPPGELRRRIDAALNAVILSDENIRLKTLLPLYSLGEQFLASSTEEEVLEGLVRTAVGITDAAAVSVMLYDKAENCLRIAISRGLDREKAARVRVVPGDQIAGWVFQKGKPVILNRNTQNESIFASILNRPDITAAISFPLTVRGTILGVLNISRTGEAHNFSQADIEMLNVVCSQATMALDNVRAIAEREEKARMLALFEQYVAPEVADLLIANSSDPVDLGEVRRLTVLFADIRNFTGLVQRMRLDTIRLFLNQFFRFFTDIIFHHRGTVDKFMGDAVLAVFGAPVELDNANYAAVRSALEIRERFQALKQRWILEQDYFRDIEIGIGITCGDTFFGNVGSARRFDYTVVGPHVNIAQRLASRSRDGAIYLTRQVVDDAADLVDGAVPTALRLKGLEREMAVYEIRRNPVTTGS